MIKKDKKGEKLIHVKSYEDFLKINDLDKKIFHTVIFVIDNDIDLRGIKIAPIDASGMNVILKGEKRSNNRVPVIKGITIDNGEKQETGFFSRTKSFSIVDLNIADAFVKGGVCTGALVGSVDNDAKVKSCGITSEVLSKAYCGGLFGTANKVVIDDTIVMSTVRGKDLIGGVVGVCESAQVINSAVKSEIVGAIGKAQGNVAGYNSEEMAPVVNYMSKVAMETAKTKYSPEDMELLELFIRR